MSLTLLVSACGATTARDVAPSELAGWRSVPDPPGISQLAPDLSGLEVTRRLDRRALVRKGDTIRATTFTFATPKEAEEAQTRGSGDDYLRALEDGFHGTGVQTARGYRLSVVRPAETGSDTVEVYLVRRGPRLTVVELVSAKGFPPRVRDRALAAVSR